MQHSGLPDSTPVLVGGGQAVWREPPSELAEERAPHPMDLCAEAAQRALGAAGAKKAIAPALQSITVIRMFEDSSPRRAHDFGRSNNPPRSVAQRIGANPAEAVYTTAGGETPQRKLNELCERIANGEIDSALLCGVENIATIRHALRTGAKLDFEEQVEGSLEDEGFGSYWFDQHQIAHRLTAPIHCYPLLEHTIRRSRGNSVDTHLGEMAKLFSRFSDVAAENPYAYRTDRYTAEQLADTTGKNRLISHPYGRLLNARDTVDLSSAVLLMSVGRARELGIPDDNWVFLHGCGEANEKPLMLERESFDRSVAARSMAESAFSMAGIRPDELSTLDLYSCFPSAVEIVAKEIGVDEDDPRGLTTTGGLPYFGGPGNSYSLHAIAEAIRRAREEPGSYHWVSANGGNVNKQTAGIYSTRRLTQPWRREDPRVAQAKIDALPVPPATREPEGPATVETYTVAFDRDTPSFGLVIGRDSESRRFLSNVKEDDPDSLKALLEGGFEVKGTVSTADGLSTFRAVD